MVEENYKALEACLKYDPSFQVKYKGNTLCALSEIIKPDEITCPYIEKGKKVKYKDDRKLAICKRKYDGFLSKIVKKLFNKSFSQTK